MKTTYGQYDTIQSSLNVGMIMHGCESSVLDSITGDNVRVTCVIGGDRSMGNHGTSANKSSHAESSYRLNDLTVAIEVPKFYDSY